MNLYIKVAKTRLSHGSSQKKNSSKLEIIHQNPNFFSKFFNHKALDTTVESVLVQRSMNFT